MNKKIIWGIVIVVIVIVGGYFTFKHNINGGLDYGKTGPVEKPNIETSESTSTAQSNLDWKTYTNTKLAYEIKYPSDWKINEGTVNSGKDIEIYADNNPASVKISSIASEQCVEKPWELKVAYSVETTKCFKDTKGNTIKISAGFGKDGLKEKIEKIISTFKFTSQTNVEQKAPVSNTSSIKVISPNGGEVFKTGDIVKINWNNEIKPGIVKVMFVAGKVPDGHYTNNGSMSTTRGYEIYNGKTKDSLDWLIPEGYPGKWFIRIESENGSVDYSDTTFTITN